MHIGPDQAGPESHNFPYIQIVPCGWSVIGACLFAYHIRWHQRSGRYLRIAVPTHKYRRWGRAKDIIRKFFCCTQRFELLQDRTGRATAMSLTFAGYTQRGHVISYWLPDTLKVALASINIHLMYIDIYIESRKWNLIRELC